MDNWAKVAGSNPAPATKLIEWIQKKLEQVHKFAGSEFERPQAGPKGGGQEVRSKSCPRYQFYKDLMPELPEMDLRVIRPKRAGRSPDSNNG